jgi:uncharacterized protein (TIGR02246 family)
MIRTVLCLLLLLLAPHAAYAQNMPEWARERTTAWYNAFNSGNATALANMHTDDAVLLIAGITMEGRQAIEKFHAGQFAKVTFNCEWKIQGVSVVYRLGVVWGSDTCTETPKGGARPLKWNGRFMTIYQMQADGTWMIIRDTGEEDPRAVVRSTP